MSDTMNVLATIQNAALDPKTSEETLRDLLISTLELVEKDENLIRSYKRQLINYEKMNDIQEQLIEKLTAVAS